MRRDRLAVPARLEALHEIARRHHFHSAIADVLDRARVHARQVGDRALRRVLHGEAPDTVEQRVEPGSEGFATCVHELFSGQLVEIVRLDGVHELPRVGRWRESCRTTGAWSSCRCRPGRPGSSQRDSSRGSHRAAIRRVGRRRAPTARRRCRSASCKYSGAGKGCRPVPLRRRGPNVPVRRIHPNFRSAVFHFFDHTGDIGIDIEARDLPSVFGTLRQWRRPRTLRSPTAR